MFHKFKITTCAFILCLFGLTLMTVSQVFAADSAAFVRCQQIKINGNSVPLMKQKKNCFKNLAAGKNRRNSPEFKQCKQIRPQGKFQPMKQKKNCFRDIARNDGQLSSSPPPDTQEVRRRGPGNASMRPLCNINVNYLNQKALGERERECR